MKTIVNQFIISTVIAISGIGCSSANGQANVSYQVITNLANTASTAGPLRNQGQTQHLLYYKISGNGCNVVPATYPFAPIYLQASFDGSNYFNITPIPRLTAHGTTYYDGTVNSNGLYPFLQVYIPYGLGVNCVTNIWYSGTTAPYSVPQQVLAPSSQYQTLYDGRVSAVTKLDLLNLTNYQSSKSVIYGGQISNQSASNPVTITLFTVGNNDCATGTVSSYWHTWTIPANETVVMPTSVVPYYIGPTAGNLCETSTGTSPSYTVSLIYRYE